MTLDEALKILEEILEVDDSIYQFNPIYLQALKMVICCMEALPKIREEIASYKDDKLIHAERNEMIDIVFEIIDRHLKEVEGNESVEGMG